MRGVAALAALLLSAGAVLAQTPPSSPTPKAPPAPKKKDDAKKKDAPKKPAKQTRPIVTLTTEKGEIQIELFPVDAPRNVANVLALTQRGFYDNLTFHRIEDWVAQGGDPAGNGTGGPGYLVDNETNRALKHVRGAVGMANSGRDTAGSQFYILKKDAPGLDNGNYTLVGMVVAGMEVVDRLAAGDKMTKVVASLPDNFRPAPFGPSRRAEAQNLALPDLPDDAASRTFARVVRVQARIALDGSATVAIVRGSGDEEIDDRVLAALKRWRWSPALKEGQPLASEQQFEYDLMVGTRLYDR